MKFTLSWLKDHLETSASLSDMTNKLVDLGLEVENIEDPTTKLQGFMVAEVIEVRRHPNADRLSLCMAHIGNGEHIQVVCGAPNVRQGMKVAFASIGVIIPRSGMVLKKGKIRDVESFGMFCSAQELDMGEDSDGIMDLNPALPAGIPLAEALGLADPVIDVSITPNRSDCFGVRGIARDLAASGLGTLKPLPFKETTGQLPCPIGVTIEDSHACPDFQVRVIKGVRNGPSPDWVQRRLRAIGLRPISALVDVTNYLTHDLGRPLHVFDLTRIHGNLTVRLSKKGEKLTALNGKDYTLEDGATVIADAVGVLSLGGIMGGSSTACLESTTDVLIECAAFDPIRTAQTGRALSILSDARIRFERGVDPSSIHSGLEAATHLIQEWCGGSVSDIMNATHKNPLPKTKPSPITLTHHKLKNLGGYDIPLSEAKGFLEALGFKILSSNSTDLTVEAPSYRPDIEGPADLVEEVLRLKGYHTIPAIPLPLSCKAPPSSPTSALVTKRVLASRGLQEVVTWSFMEESLAKKFGQVDSSLRIANPISIDLNFMRPSIIPNLIQATIRNQDRGQETVALFEVGPQFKKEGQQLVAAGILMGLTHPQHWTTPSCRSFDVFDAKAHTLAVLNIFELSSSALQIDANGPDYYHPNRKGTLKQGNRVLAVFGEIHPSLINKMKGEGLFAAFEIFLDELPSLQVKKATLHLSPYQPVVRDFAFLVDETVPADQIIKTIAKVDRRLITTIHIFDIYRGDKLEKGKKSLALQVRFEPQTGTLTDEQITEVSDKIIAQVIKVTGGTLRSV